MKERYYLQVFDYGRELLKWIAIITMTIDHIGVILYPDLTVLRLIGRLSFPLFAYLLILGIENTHNIRSYFLRLLSFALISQIPFFVATETEPFESLNIFFTLAAGLLFIYLAKKKSVFAIAPVLASLVISFDYGVYGIATIGCMYILKEDIKFGVVSLVMLNILLLVPFNTQFLSITAIPLILFHRNGSLNLIKANPKEAKIPYWRKYFFYLYYPLHLTLLYSIKILFNFV